jgi:phosphoglycerate dehydrogenase-like enzyme
MSARFGVWFERMPRPEYAQLLAGVAEIAGAASASPEPLTALADSHAIIASSRLRNDGPLMDRAEVPLCVISPSGTGLDNVAIDDATQRGSPSTTFLTARPSRLRSMHWRSCSRSRNA